MGGGTLKCSLSSYLNINSAEKNLENCLHGDFISIVQEKYWKLAGSEQTFSKMFLLLNRHILVHPTVGMLDSIIKVKAS